MTRCPTCGAPVQSLAESVFDMIRGILIAAIGMAPQTYSRSRLLSDSGMALMQITTPQFLPADVQ